MSPALPVVQNATYDLGYTVYRDDRKLPTVLITWPVAADNVLTGIRRVWLEEFSSQLKRDPSNRYPNLPSGRANDQEGDVVIGLSEVSTKTEVVAIVVEDDLDKTVFAKMNEIVIEAASATDRVIETRLYAINEALGVR